MYRHPFVRCYDGLVATVFRPVVLLVCILLAVMACMAGCRGGAISAPAVATAPADPYATALSRLQIFAQVLQDASTGAKNLHATYLVRDDGTTGTVLDDAAYSKVQTALHFAAAEGTALSNLLAQRASGAVIAAEMARVTTGLAQQLTPDQLGIRNGISQQKYVLWVNLINAGVNTLASELALLIPQESTLGRSGSTGPGELAYGARAAYPNRGRAGAEGPASRQADRPERIAQLRQCKFRQGARYLARRYA